MTTKADPDLLAHCKGKDFLLSKAVDGKAGFKCLQAISEAKQALETKHGAKMGAGSTRRTLKAKGFFAKLKGKGFVEMKPLGAGQIVQNEDLCLHHGSLDNWVVAFQEYAVATKHGVLILAKTLENFRYWAKSHACHKEVKGIPDGRLFAYLEHTDDDEGGRCGYIVSVDAQTAGGCTTVRNGKGYAVWPSGACYQGELKDGLRNGYGTYTFAGEWKKVPGKDEKMMDICEDGAIYIGKWKDGKMNGRGKFTWANGNVYDGEWKDDNMNGKGKFTFPDGEEYDGQWKDDKKHGRGKYTWADGDVYDGEFKDNVQC